MKTLKALTLESAPEKSKATLQSIQKGFGFIPNLMATFANSPAVLNGYMALDAAYSQSSLTPKEQQLILLVVSTENNCRYCTAAHSTILKSMMKVDAALVKAIRAKADLQDSKANALVKFTREVVSERGFVSETTKENFLKEGYSEVAMMEVLMGVALKTISNYLDHLSPTPLDAAFASEA